MAILELQLGSPAPSPLDLVFCLSGPSLQKAHAIGTTWVSLRFRVCKTKSIPDANFEPTHLRNIYVQEAGTESSPASGLAQKLALNHMPKENPLGLYLVQHRLVLSAVPASFWTSRLLIPASEPGFTCYCHLCVPPI